MTIDFKTPFKYRFETWIFHWIDLFATIVCILTFGILLPTWASKFIWWIRRRRMEQYHRKDG